MSRTTLLAALLAGSVGCSKTPVPVVSDAAPPPSGSSAAAGDAAFDVDGTAYPVKSAVKVRRGDLTEEYVLSSDTGGCELLQDKVRGDKQPRVRLSWTVAPDFVTGELHAVGAWGLFVNEHGAAGHGALISEKGPVLSGGTPNGASGVSFQLAPIHPAFLPNTLSGKGTVTPIECPRTGAPPPPVSSLVVEVGSVRVAIRSVILVEQASDQPGKPIRALELSSQSRTCDDREEGELLLQTTALGDGSPGLVILGKALPDELRKTVSADVTKLAIKHGPIGPAMNDVPVSVDGTAQLGRLRIKLSGQAVAHVCRVAEKGSVAR